MSLLPTTRRRFLTLPRRASLLREMLDAQPRTSGYTQRRAVIARRLDACTLALDNAERTNAAKFMMSTRRGFSLGLN